MIDRMKFSIKDPISAGTHFIGFLAAIPIMVLLIMKAAAEATPMHVFSFAVFGASLLLLYGASTLYHALNLDEKRTAQLRRVDHMMIFVLIAGTYTPVCLVPLRGKLGWSLLAAVWGVAIAGIALKALWLNAPRWLSTLIYVLMGWMVMVAFMPLEKAVPIGGIALLAAGGVTYTVGALVYALKLSWLNFKRVSFHDIFHIFVMGGTACHVAFMFLYVL